MREAIAPLIALTVLLVSTAGAAAPPASPADPKEIARLARENDLLKKQADLAQGKNFYLVLDPRASTLKLLLNATELQTFAIRGVEVGVPEVAFVARGLPPEWEGRVWVGGTLDPPRDRDRLEIQAAPPTAEGKEPDIPIPPTPEEAYPVPPVYHVRYAGGLSIEIRTDSLEPSSKGFWSRVSDRVSRWWRDVKAASAPRPTDAIRLHLIMSKKDADSFYRALPPDTRLLVLPPTS